MEKVLCAYYALCPYSINCVDKYYMEAVILCQKRLDIIEKMAKK